VNSILLTALLSFTDLHHKSAFSGASALPVVEQTTIKHFVNCFIDNFFAALSVRHLLSIPSQLSFSDKSFATLSALPVWLPYKIYISLK